MAEGANNPANGQLVKGAGCGTRQWNEDFNLTQVDGATSNFKVAKATGNTTVAGTLAVTGAITASGGVTGTVTGAVAATTITASSTLTVTGTTTLNGQLTVNNFTGVQAFQANQQMFFAGIEVGLTAHAGGTQAAALLLSFNKFLHVVATSATDADSVQLGLPGGSQASGSGAIHMVRNSGGHIVQVYGKGADTIDGVASSTGFSLAAGKSAIFIDSAAGAWVSLAGA